MERRSALTNAFVFGMLLKHFREAAGLRQEDLALGVPCDRSLIARVEAGTRTPRENLVKRCDDLLPTEGALYRLWVEIDWTSQEVEYPDWFNRRVEMEAEAVSLRAYQTQVMPGLLQTEEYVHALFSRGSKEDPALTDYRVRVRLGRQRRFLDAEDALLVAVLDESCIRNVVGSSAVMHRQCAHLLSVGQRPNIRIQVAPSHMGHLVRPRTSMCIIKLPDGHEWAYSESVNRGHFCDEPDVLAQLSRTYDVLRADVPSAEESAELIREAMEGFRQHDKAMAQEQLQRPRPKRLRGNRPRHPRRRRRS
ncbi:helix-turn-helix transcriptional regulator [Streptomyces sp. UNOC14_S4]|uniref:helix-turn-helix domain-containing protein n=1 Tax=Streptomyces sp. UNOC14_S4 TaxID=2872340 RepID=UPI001E49FEA7|nr:helix-turn-helix transcriptional regulator [Streptomyces sp. UNOC14_S4]MCC3770129.1 helix-turn-helix domain-containing protein [Streptomyces sp. UNOC14_S4]